MGQDAKTIPTDNAHGSMWSAVFLGGTVGWSKLLGTALANGVISLERKVALEG